MMGSAQPGTSLLRNRDFMLFWSGQTVSQVGTQITILALPLAAIVLLKASAFEVGLLSAADTSAYLIAALPAGVLVDRLSTRRLMLWCDMCLVVVIGSVPVARAAGVLTLSQLYVVALVSSVFGVALLVSSTSYLPTLVTTDQLTDGNGKLFTSESFAQLAGPSLGALLVGLFGAAMAMAGDALSYVLGGTCLLLIRRREQSAEPAEHGAGPGFREQMGEGLRLVMREPILRKATAWSGTANFFVIMVETLGPVFLIRTDHVRPAYVGLLMALAAFGGVAGGLLSNSLGKRIGSARAAWLSVTALSTPGLLIPLAGPGWWVLLFAVGWICWTFSATVCNVLVMSYLQRTCPPAILGRVSATYRWVKWGTLPLGGIAAGVLGTVIGVRATLWVAVIATCLSGLWLVFSPLRRMRDLPETSLGTLIQPATGMPGA